MENMLAFVIEVMQAVPAFLMAEPICYFVGMTIALFAVKAIKQIIA